MDAASHEGKIYVVGGYVGNWVASNVLLIYDSDKDTWEFGKNMPTPRGALSAEFVSDKLYAVGGFGIDGTYSTVEQYDPDTDSWEAKASMPTPREHLASSVVDGKLYAIGGFAKGVGNLNVNEVYDLQNDSWEIMTPMPTARNGITASELNGAIFVFGGEDTVKTFNENEAYIPQEDVWHTLQPLPVPRQGLFSSVIGDTIYVMGGGFVPGASYSNLNHAYQNNAIPEFGTVAVLVLITSVLAVIFASRHLGKKQAIMPENDLA